MTLVDSNIFLDIWSEDAEWGAWSAAALQSAASKGAITVNPVIVAELCRGFEQEDDLMRALREASVRIAPLPANASWPAAQAYAAYRRRGGHRMSQLPDFFIGAHALVEKWPLLTRDPKRFRAYFPKVKLIAPR